MSLNLKLGFWMKGALMVGGIVALTACSSTKKHDYDQAAIDDANSSYARTAQNREEIDLDGNGGVRTNGAGQYSNFAESNQQDMSKRIYYFDFDSNVVHENDKPAIVANADYLVAHPKARVTLVEGHTDPRGSREYNIGLGERRAKAVAGMLIAKGVNRNQIRIVSYGAQKLAALGHNEADYQKDRRVALVYTKS